jgi:hypothetical protein
MRTLAALSVATSPARKSQHGWNALLSRRLASRLLSALAAGCSGMRNCVPSSLVHEKLTAPRRWRLASPGLRISAPTRSSFIDPPCPHIGHAQPGPRGMKPTCPAKMKRKVPGALLRQLRSTGFARLTSRALAGLRADGRKRGTSPIPLARWAGQERLDLPGRLSLRCSRERRTPRRPLLPASAFGCDHQAIDGHLRRRLPGTHRQPGHVCSRFFVASRRSATVEVSIQYFLRVPYLSASDGTRDASFRRP